MAQSASHRQHLPRSISSYSSIAPLIAEDITFQNGVFLNAHPLAEVPKTFQRQVERIRASEMSEERRRQWEMDVIRDYDDQRLLKIEHMLARAWEQQVDESDNIDELQLVTGTV